MSEERGVEDGLGWGGLVENGDSRECSFADSEVRRLTAENDRLRRALQQAHQDFSEQAFHGNDIERLRAKRHEAQDRIERAMRGGMPTTIRSHEP